MKISRIILFCLLCCIFSSKLSAQDLAAQLQAFYKQNNIMGLAVQILENNNTIFKSNFGMRDFDRGLEVNNNTLFRMASLSKSMTAAGLMLLISQGKVDFTDTLQKIFGFKVVNPHFPNIPITVQMILTHQSSYIEGPSYDKFLTDTYYNSKSGADIPNISTLFVQGGKYYNASAFDSVHPTGTFYRYANLNYLLAGTIIEKISGQRFDQYMKEKVFSYFSEAMTFNPASIKSPNDLGVLYEGDHGKWVATKDNYNGTIPDFNMTGYKMGTNAGYYGPQGSVRASVTDLAKYINMIRNDGKHNSTQVIPAAMVAEMRKWRYQFHGKEHGGESDFHAYGTGLFSTTYRNQDNIWPNKVVVGHIGDAYGLASAYFYSGNYCVAYVMSGILNGYTYNKFNHFSVERQKIHNLTYAFVYGSK